MRRFLIALACVLALASCGNGGKKSASRGDAELPGESIKSPDGTLEVSFFLLDDGSPMYCLKRNGETVVRPSLMGFVFRGKKKTEGYDNIAGKAYKDPVDFTRGFTQTDVQKGTFDETWDPVLGEEAHIRNHYNSMDVTLEKKVPLDRWNDNEVTAQMKVSFRLYDDGLAFRYEFPENKGGLTYFVVSDEATQFRMTGDHTAWWIPGDYDTQEYNYTKSRLSEIKSVYESTLLGNSSQMVFSKGGVQTALQMKTDGGLYINIHEAAVLDYPTANLDYDDSDKAFKIHLTPDAEGWGARLQTPCKTPWRTVMVVGSGPEVLASRLILNLNEPCAIEDVSWIHPTKYMGVWWEMITGHSQWSYTNDFPSIQLGVSDYTKAKPHGNHGASNENVKKYIDFASENGFDGLLIEGWNEGWEDWYGCQKDYVFDFVTPYPDFDIAELNRYAHSKGIRLIMHHETSSSVDNYERHMDAAYDLMNKYGYDAVKSGYVGDIIPYGEHHYSQSMINHYHRAVVKAAAHHIMVNAHEAVRPTGLCRTWPNMIGNESAMGGEYRSNIMAHHVTILPFTRLQGGPMDYTPGIFEPDMSRLNPSDNQKMITTLCKQLALYVTLYSPLQMAADVPEHYKEHMDAFQFIKDVAVDWQRSEYLVAEPGDCIVIARQAKKSTLDIASKGTAALPDARKGYVNGAIAFCAGDKDVWFVGGVTGEDAREVDVPLKFLSGGKSYEATIYEDAPDADWEKNPKAYVIRKENVNSSTVLKMKMARSGGFAISLKEI